MKDKNICEGETGGQINTHNAHTAEDNNRQNHL